MLPQLTKSEFKTFVLIYAAHVDYNYSDAETQFILEHSTASEFESMSELFGAHTDYHSLKIIIAHKEKYYQDEREKAELYAQITELFLVDGVYSRPEKIFIDFLERLIKQNHESESN